MKKSVGIAIVLMVIILAAFILYTDYSRKNTDRALAAEVVEEKPADEVTEPVAEVTETAAEVTETAAEVTEAAAEVTEAAAEVTEPVTEAVESTSEPALPSVWEDSFGKVYFLGENQLESALALTLQERINSSEFSAWHQYDAVAEGDIICKDENSAEITALYGLAQSDIPEKLEFLRNGANLFIYTDEETHQIVEQEKTVFHGAPDSSFERSVFCEEHRSIKTDCTINLAYLNAKLESDAKGYGIYGKFPYSAVSKIPTAFVLVQRTVKVNGEVIPALTWVVRVCNDYDIGGVVVVPPSGPSGGGDNNLPPTTAPTPTSVPTPTPTTAPTPTPTVKPSQGPGFNPRPTPTVKPSQGPGFNPRPTLTPGFSDPTPTVEPEFSDPGFNPKPTATPGVTKVPDFNPKPTVAPGETKVPDFNPKPTATPGTTKAPEATKAPDFNPKPTATPGTTKAPETTKAPTSDEGSFNQKPENSTTKAPAFSDKETDAGFSERPSAQTEMTEQVTPSEQAFDERPQKEETGFSDRPNANSEPVSDNEPTPPPAFA